jgi:hypothetical protein
MAAGHIFIIGCLVGPLDKSRGVTHPPRRRNSYARTIVGRTFVFSDTFRIFLPRDGGRRR